MFKDSSGQYTIGDVLWVRPSLAFAKNYFDKLNKYDLVCAEIGVQRGDNAYRILRVANPKWLYLIDCWENINWKERGEDYSGSSDNYKYVSDTIGKEKNVIVIKDYSQIALPKLETDLFDYIYIDGDHSVVMCKKDILNSIPLLKIGGILAGHDYGVACEELAGGVAKAVRNVFGNTFVYVETGDWWVVIDENIKNIGKGD